jgi:hypothetical protein
MVTCLSAPASDESCRSTIRDASTSTTSPSRLATMATPESLATTPSMPVPTRGASALIRGTAWRCMLEPISARLASSFSRKGIRDAETLTSWLGEMSISSISSRSTIINSPATREVTVGLIYSDASLMGALAWAMGWSFSSKALKTSHPWRPSRCRPPDRGSR